MSSANTLTKRVIEVTGLAPSEIARQLGVSTRTVQRWRIGIGEPLVMHLPELAKLTRSSDPALASHIHDQVDAFHRALGLPLPPRPDRDAIRNEPGSRLADAALLAAAELLGVPVEKVRPAVRAALVTAQQRGATLEALITGIDRGTPG